MRRPVRILLNVVTILSALLWAASSLLWVRSATSDDRREDWVFTANQGGRWPRPAVGRIEFGALGPPTQVRWGTHTLQGPQPPYPDVTSYTLVLDGRTTLWAWTGFERQEGLVVVEPSRPPASLVGPLPTTALPFKLWFVPYWFPTVLFASLPVARGLTLFRYRLRAGRRFRRGACIRCGYDLRATPDRCPECGASRA